MSRDGPGEGVVIRSGPVLLFSPKHALFDKAAVLVDTQLT